MHSPSSKRQALRDQKRVREEKNRTGMYVVMQDMNEIVFVQVKRGLRGLSIVTKIRSDGQKKKKTVINGYKIM